MTTVPGEPGTRRGDEVGDLGPFLDSLLPAILDFGPWTVELYGDGPESQLAHYRRLARRLLDQFGDRPLAIAGFLHGIAPEQLTPLRGRVSDEVFEILRGWEQLARLGSQTRTMDKAFSDELEKAIFQVPEARSALLLVIECLDRLDPTGAVTAWNRKFRQQPGPVDPIDKKAVVTERELAGVERYGQVGPLMFVERLVAPAAKAWGLWQEHTALRDAVFFVRERPRFEALIDLAIEAHSKWCAKRARTIYEALATTPESAKKWVVFWEWRHLAAIAEQMGSTLPGQPGRPISRCGFITIVCPTVGDCYQALGEIHRHFDFRTELFRDSIGRPRRSGYQALHTGILDPCATGEQRGTLTLRLVPKSGVQHRFEPAGPHQLETLRQELGSWESEEIQVFSAAGEPLYVSAGTTVLELAAMMEPMALPMIVGARVHGQWSDRFRVLRSGDIVRFEKGKPQALPTDWSRRVAKASIPKIEWALRTGYGPILERAGRAWLRQALGRIQVDAASLDVFFEAALTQTLAIEERGKHDTRWWLRQVGLVNRKLRGEPVPRRPVISEERAQAFVATTVRCFHRMRSLVPILETNPAEVVSIQRCPICSPHQHSALVVAESDGRLVLHREGERCSQGATALVWRSITAGQVFHVEMLNEAGRLQEVVGVFSRRQLNVRESVVRTLGPRWGIARFEISPTGPKEIADIGRELESLEGVRAFAPGMDVPPLLLQSLPPRDDDAQWLLSRFPEPFVCGPVVRESYHFYGRASEMDQLLTLVEAARQSPSTGELAFVSGPLKAGKTSLVQRVQSILTQSQDDLTVCAYHKAAQGETWSEVETILRTKVTRRLAELAHIWSFPVPEIDESDFLAWLAALQESIEPRPTFLLAIDEAVRLFERTSQEPGPTRNLVTFCHRVRHCPGVVVVWIGPSAPVYRLERPLGELLEDRARPIPVRPLNLEETGRMMRAQKLSLFHEIEVGPRIVRAIHQLTGGDPFWTAHLGHRMWRIVTAEQPGRKVRFNFEVMRRAAEDLIHTATPFKGRIFPSGLGSVRERSMAELLFVLADLEDEAAEASGTSKGTPGFDLPTILDRLPWSERGLSPGVARHHLAELAGRGGVERERGQRWRLAVPLVKTYVQSLREEMDEDQRSLEPTDR